VYSQWRRNSRNFYVNHKNQCYFDFYVKVAWISTSLWIHLYGTYVFRCSMIMYDLFNTVYYMYELMYKTDWSYYDTYIQYQYITSQFALHFKIVLSTSFMTLYTVPVYNVYIIWYILYVLYIHTYIHIHTPYALYINTYTHYICMYTVNNCIFMYAVAVCMYDTYIHLHNTSMYMYIQKLMVHTVTS
jgi:hypothetical protein